MNELLMPEILELRTAELRAEAEAHRLAKTGREGKAPRITWSGLKWLDRRPGQTQRPAKAI